MVQLSQWGTALGLERAVRVLVSEEFDADTAELTDESVMTVLHWGEAVGTLVKHDLFNRDLANDWVWWPGLWERLGPAARRARAELGEERMFENLELLATGA